MSKLGNQRLEAEGALVANRRGINLIEGANINITPADDGPNDIIDVTIAAALDGGSIVVRKDSGADVGTQPRLNFIEGANITLTIADDGGDSEIDITIAGPVAADSVWLDQFFPAVNPNSQKGAYAAVLLTDAIDSTVYQTFMIPDDIATITTAEIIVICDGTGNMRWQCDTAMSACGEDYEAHTDSIAADVTAVTTDERECIDISAALTDATGGDLVGIQFIRTASHGDDTVNADVYYVGLLLQGTV